MQDRVPLMAVGPLVADDDLDAMPGIEGASVLDSFAVPGYNPVRYTSFKLLRIYTYPFPRGGDARL